MKEMMKSLQVGSIDLTNFNQRTSPGKTPRPPVTFGEKGVEFFRQNPDHSNDPLSTLSPKSRQDNLKTLSGSQTDRTKKHDYIQLSSARQASASKMQSEREKRLKKEQAIRQVFDTVKAIG